MTDKLPPSTLRMGLPSGSLQGATVDLFGKAGYRISIPDRSVFPRFDDDKISAVLFRAQRSPAQVDKRRDLLRRLDGTWLQLKRTQRLQPDGNAAQQQQCQQVKRAPEKAEPQAARTSHQASR